MLPASSSSSATLSAASLSLCFITPLNHPFYPPKHRALTSRNLRIRRRCRPCPAAASRTPSTPSSEQAAGLRQWDTLTARFAGASNIPFLLIQIPQILLNYNNLISGNKAALLAVPWLVSRRFSVDLVLRPNTSGEVDDEMPMSTWQGMLTGLLGNMTLLSYFAKKKEVEAIVVQTLGVLSIYVVLGQLAMAQAMSLPYFAAISVLVVAGLVLNFVNYFGWLSSRLWLIWEDFITVAGISVLPQVMWSTFVPFLPKSILPGVISFAIALAAIILARMRKLPERMVTFIRSLSAWTATLLFMWMPIAQMWTTYLNPDNIKGLSAFTILLGMIGNGLMIPRALFIRDLIWFTGASWASFLHGWGNLACMYYFKSISWTFFLGAALSLYIWTGIALWRDGKVHGYSLPLKSLQELISAT